MRIVHQLISFLILLAFLLVLGSFLHSALLIFKPRRIPKEPQPKTPRPLKPKCEDDCLCWLYDSSIRISGKWRCQEYENWVLCGSILKSIWRWQHDQSLIRSLKRFVSRVKLVLKQWSKPVTVSIVVCALSDLRRSRKDLIIENAMLRQQLIVLNRQVKRPQLTQGDRVGLVLLARLTEFWQQALHIVQPDMLLRWHRDLFRRYWRRKSKPEKREPRTSPKPLS